LHVCHVQHQFLGAPAPRGEEALELQAAAERPSGEQAGLRFERHGGKLRRHCTPAARLVLLGLVTDLEVDRRKPGRRVAQRPELKQPAAQL
jgi:hypothetical protein